MCTNIYKERTTKDYSIILKSEEYIYKTLYIYTRNTNNICG